MTSILQPLDVCVNKPFKNQLHHLWATWMMDGEKTFTKTGRTRKPELETICKWILEAWESIPNELICQSFLKTSISNNLDGTQDDAIWADSDEEASDGEEP